jgi:hypothetical protein
MAIPMREASMQTAGEEEIAREKQEMKENGRE